MTHVYVCEVNSSLVVWINFSCWISAGAPQQSINNKKYHYVSSVVFHKYHKIPISNLEISSTAYILEFILSQQNDLITFSQSPLVLHGSISFLEPHRSSKRCVPLHKSNLWNILGTNESVLWNILDNIKQNF